MHVKGNVKRKVDKLCPSINYDIYYDTYYIPRINEETENVSSFILPFIYRNPLLLHQMPGLIILYLSLTSRHW